MNEYIFYLIDDNHVCHKVEFMTHAEAKRRNKELEDCQWAQPSKEYDDVYMAVH